MSQRNHLSFDLTPEQWADVNQAMLACFARRSKPGPYDPVNGDPVNGDPVNEALAIICREWLATHDLPT
ncbi:MAG TPA: hypothetical protein VND64_33775 [Pirellulales bacterium]|nr:hypothetical protein [Pirellulales bacterium]